MKLMVFLLAYLVRRRLDASDRWSVEGFWRRLFQTFGKARPGKESAISRGLFLVGVPALLLALVVWQASGSELALWLHLPEWLILVWLMGAPGWMQRLQAYSEAWGRGDMQAAWHHIRDSLPAEERGAALAPDEMHRALSRTLIADLFERYFLVAFWFVAGGIGAALLVRGLVALRDHWPQAPARQRFARLVDVASWIPARLLAATFGLAGDLAGWVTAARGLAPRLSMSPRPLLLTAANGALTGYALDPARFGQLHPDEWPDFGGRSLSGIRGLLTRSMLVWVCVLALLVIAGLV